VQSAYNVQPLHELYQTIQTVVHSESNHSILCRPIEGGRHFVNATERTAHFYERAAPNRQRNDAHII
jgi:hypothetical protein